MQQLDKKAVWLFFISNLVGLSVFGAALILWVGFPLSQTEEFPYAHQISMETLSPMRVAAVVLGVLVLSWIFAKLTYHFYRYEMADIVFKKEHGIIWKKYVSIPYDRIQNVDIHRGILARLLGLSDLHIQTAGGVAPYQSRSLLGGAISGAYTEGRLIGLSREEAERLRDELIRKSRDSRSNQGL